MLILTCPYCGPRDEIEFLNDGEGHVDRPVIDSATDEEWTDYLFLHTNPRGELRERWVHSYGCGRWFHVVRDTLTHAVTGSYAIDAAGPRT